MLQAALAKFYGCSPVHIRGMTMVEIEASILLAREINEG